MTTTQLVFQCHSVAKRYKPKYLPIYTYVLNRENGGKIIAFCLGVWNEGIDTSFEGQSVFYELGLVLMDVIKLHSGG